MHVIPAARYLARRKRQNLLLGLLALVALCMLLLGVYGRHATEQFHCALPETLRPVMLRNASSRLTLLTVLDSCSRVAVSAASLRLLK